MSATCKTDSDATRTILVTDSGLGGLSVFNDIACRLESSSPWQSVRLIYFNAWPAPHRGYNHFETHEKRVAVFNNALSSMAKFNPDQILIACNTLSVLYPETDFRRDSGIPVQGIVDHGVQMLNKNLAADPGSAALVLGTPTTTNAGSHKNAVINMGIDPGRVFNIACTNLAGWIEREPFSPEVDAMISGFVKEAAEKTGPVEGRIFAGLCCTHFGYRTDLFEKAFEKAYSPGKVQIVNPNIEMAKNASATDNTKEPTPAHLDIEIVSQAEWTKEQIKAYLNLMPNMPQKMRGALKQYRLDKNLFSTQ